MSLAASLLLGLAGGRSEAAQNSGRLAEDTALRLHWLGKKQLATLQTATNLMSIWSLPESGRLEAQTLDKLARWAAGEKITGPQTTDHGPQGPGPRTADHGPRTTVPAPLSAAAAPFRPLVNDLLQEEFYLEMRGASGQPGELALAIRLPDAQARLWEASLARIRSALGATTPAAVSLSRAGAWTVLGFTRAPAANGQSAAANHVLGEMLHRIRTRTSGTPFPPRATNYWLEADLDLPRLSSAWGCGWHLPADWPRISLAVNGTGQRLRTTGELDFPKALQLNLEPWNVPTNLVHEPLISFTAMRGIRPWLSSWKAWNDLRCGQAPNQLYFWAILGLPFQSYCAAQVPDAKRAVSQISSYLLDRDAWLRTNAMGTFQRPTNSDDGLIWTSFPFVAPFLKSYTKHGAQVAYAGLAPDAAKDRPASPKLIEQLHTHPDLVYYDWELTGPRIEGWMYIAQISRVGFHKPQIPPESASSVWLKAAGLKLSNCGTMLTKSGPAQISFLRNSTIGLTAAELQLMADWLESPQFPKGLHTFLAPPPPAPRMMARPPTAAAKTNNHAPTKR